MSSLTTMVFCIASLDRNEYFFECGSLYAAIGSFGLAAAERLGPGRLLTRDSCCLA